jgi:hypothetical protein
MKSEVEIMQRQLTRVHAAFQGIFQILPLSLNSRTAYVYQRSITSAHVILQSPSFSKLARGIDALDELAQKKQPISAYFTQLAMSPSEHDYSRTNAKTDGVITYEYKPDTLLRLQAAYVQNVHGMFPFLDHTTLSKWIHEWNADSTPSPIQWTIVMLVAALGELSIGTSKETTMRPGLEYYAHAADTLAYQHEGMTLEHAQAQTLAALYLIQEARVRESWCRISNACRITLTLADS